MLSAEICKPSSSFLPSRNATERTNTIDVPLKEESIFNYYSITNEAKFLKENPQLPHEQKEYYLKENVLRFLGEFAGKVPYTKITYILRDDGLYYGDLKAMDNYRQTAIMPEATDREKAEGEGFEKVEEGLLQPANTAYWISPPKIANYGFVFYFTKELQYDKKLKGYKVTEYILRYPEKLEDVSKSNQIAYGIESNGNNKHYRKNANDFIRDPFFDLSNPNSNLKKILNLVDVDDEKIFQSQQFEKQVEEKLSGLIDQYTKTIMILSKYEPYEPEYNQMCNHAESLLTTIYNSARVIKHIVEEPENHNTESSVFERASNKELMAYFSQKKATVTGGGSCPVTNKRNQPAYLSSFNVYALMNTGNPIESFIHDLDELFSDNKFLESDSENEHYEDYECPHCHETLSGEKKNDPSSWRKTCDHCGEDVRCNKETLAA
ncbi:MAG: hypothetical protein HYW86_00385 [Candidatus Roizmanbacteria bacterium]|nr:MAG: hypothetical protein HYW86_00385 [Candidatus Roizmanbacteria bacterium]